MGEEMITQDDIDAMSDDDMRGKIAEIITYADAYDDPRATADAIIAALPDMVHPLEWSGVEADCFVICELDGRSYELCVVDTLERPCDYLWSVTYYAGRQGTRIMCGHPATFEASQAAAQAHYVADTLSPLGLTPPPQHDTPTS